MKPLFFTIIIFLLLTSSLFADVKTYNTDLNNDGKKEIITVQRFFETIPITKESLPIQINSDITIFKPDKSKVGSFSIPDHLDKVEFISLNKNGIKQIVAWSEGGMNYIGIAIYGYKDGGLYSIFKNGGCGMEADFNAEKPIIKVGRANWGAKVTQEDGTKTEWCYANEPLWQVYVWNGKEFIYDKKLSSTSEISEDEESQRFLKKAHEFLDKKTDNKSKS